MIEEIEDQDFYQCDFTTASQWEIFIARLEEVIHEWKLPQIKKGPLLKKGELTDGEWEEKSEQIIFADVNFTLTRYNLKLTLLEDLVSPIEEDNENIKNQALDDIMSMENVFPPQCDGGNVNGRYTTRPHPLARWYGLRDFMVLAPARGFDISTESKVKILLSSVYMAVNNSNCQIPIFVQIHDPWQHFYMGVCEGKGVRSEFEMVHLRRTPPHCKYLTGLLNLFKSKIASPLSLEPVTVSVRFTYVLRDWTSSTWTQEPPDFDFLHGETLGVVELGKLPFGATFDPVSELQLFTTWPQLVENMVVDSESFSDFEPSNAPQWSVRVKMSEQPACLLSEYLSEFTQLCSSQGSMQELIGDLIAERAGPSLSSSLNLLTESRVPTISKVVKRAKHPRKEKSQEGPITDDMLTPILYFLFPDADDNHKHPYSENLVYSSSCEGKKNEDLLTGLKSAPVDGLVWRLAVVMSHVVHTLGGAKAAAHLWYEFAQELRFRWEKDIAVPGVAPGFPNHRTCLLHQKLQMLNCCISRKITRQRLSKAGSVDIDELDSDSEDEEFFDCNNSEEPGGESREEKRRQKHSLWNQPVGRLEKHGNMRLLKTGEHLYIPITQDPTPKTEDQIEEDANVLLELGTDTEAAELRARMMSASLLSDMESFKAANPGACLEDFIRWYSPRDWIEEEGRDEFGQKKGTLSARMMIKDNMWVEVWNAAKPVPSRRQKRLFDDTREAEKVMHFLDSRKLSGVAELLLPTLTHAAICRLLEEQKDLPGLANALQHIIKKAQRVTRNPHPTQSHYEDLVAELVGIEAVIAQANSLEHKFHSSETATPNFHTFLSQMMSAPEVEVPGGPRGLIGSRIRAMFAEAQKATQMRTDLEPVSLVEEPWSHNPSAQFPQPSQREFVMRVMASRPAPSSTPTPQKVYALLRREEFRLAGCFSHDTIFQ